MRTRLIAFFIPVCCCLFQFICKGQVLKQFTVRDKLPSNTVYHTYCDSKGYMWFCTDKGVARFDGWQFTRFSGADGLGGNEVFNMFEDKAGRLWMFTYNGEPTYYYKGKFYNSENDKLLSRLPVLPYINAMYDDGDAIYIGYINGSILRVKQGAISWVCRVRQGSDMLQAFVKIKDCVVAVSAYSYTYIKDGHIVDRRNVEDNRSFSHRKNLITSSGDGIRMIDTAGNVSISVQYGFNYFNLLNLYRDDSGNLFVCARNGLTVINPATGRVNKLLDDITVSSIRQDLYRNYWITTLDNGIYYLNGGLLNAGKINTPASYQLINTNNTAFIQNGNRYGYLSDEHKLPAIRHIVTLNNHSNVPVYVDSNKFVYYSFNHKQGTNVYYRHTGKHEDISEIPQPKYVFKWMSDTLLFVSGNTIHKACLAPGDNYITPVLTTGARILKVCFSGYDKKMYYVNSGKLLCFDPATNNTRLVDSLRQNVTIESMCSVSSLLLLSDSRKKIHVYDLKNTSRKYSVSSNYIIYSIEQVDKQYLLYTDMGYMIGEITGRFPGFVLLHSIEYPLHHTDIQFLQVRGDYVSGRIDGHLVYFFKILLNRELNTPQLYVERVEINGRKYADSSITLKNITECNAKIYLSTVTASDDTRYRYRIQNDEKWSDWYYTSSPNLEILLSKAGQYRLEICALSVNNTPSTPIYLVLDIHPPFVYSDAFYVLLALLTVASAILFTRLYIRKKKKMFHDKLKHIQLEHKAINTLLNPHFIFNVVNNIQDLINNGSKEAANDYLVTMSKLIRQNIENLQFNLIPIENELELITNYVRLQNLRFNNRIQLNVEHDTEDMKDVYLPPLLLHTFVENAIIHGFGKEQVHLNIDVVIRLTVNDYLSVKITDNGVGLKYSADKHRAKDKTSMGIDFNRQRLQRLSEFYKVGHQLDISDRADGNNGTEVSIVLYARFARLIRP